MKEFIETSNLKFTFGSCSNCEANCCNGLRGTTYSQILKEEFVKIYKNFPILFIFGDLGFIKPVIILTNGKDYCPYQKNQRCTIYENRPTVCRTYPLSPNLDNNIYVDSSCPQINQSSNVLVENNQIIDDSYKNEIFNNYQKKYINTHFEFENLKKEDFKNILKIRNMDFYIYTGQSSSEYLKMHKESIENLKNLISKKETDFIKF